MSAWCPGCEPNVVPREAALRTIEVCSAHLAQRFYVGTADEAMTSILSVGAKKDPTEADINRAFCDLIHRGKRTTMT